MNKTIVRFHNFNFSFTDDDVIDMNDISFDGDYNPRKRMLYLLHDHGFTLCVVEATCLQDALDIAVDNDKLDRYLIDPSDDSERDDYMTTDVSEMASGFDPKFPEYVDSNGVEYWWKHEPAFLGNASEPFDIDTLGYVAFPLPKRSVTRLFGDSVEATEGHL